MLVFVLSLSKFSYVAVTLLLKDIYGYKGKDSSLHIQNPRKRDVTEKLTLIHNI